MISSRGIDGKNERTVFWRKHVEAWSREGSSQAEYCRRHKLKASAFGYWKRRLSQESAPAEFVEVRLREAPGPVGQPTGSGPSTSNIKLLIGDEFTIEVVDGFNPDSLRSLVGVLRDLQ